MEKGAVAARVWFGREGRGRRSVEKLLALDAQAEVTSATSLDIANL